MISIIAITLRFHESRAIVNATSVPETPTTQASHEDWVLFIRGDVLLGVDPLGRVLIAVDEAPRDGRADSFFLFTAEYRLGDAVSRLLPDAEVESRHGSLFVTSRGSKFAAHFVLRDVTPRDRAIPSNFEYFANEHGTEIVRVPREAGLQVPMSSLTLNNMRSGWPEMFEDDLLGNRQQNDNLQQFLNGGLAVQLASQASPAFFKEANSVGAAVAPGEQALRSVLSLVAHTLQPRAPYAATRVATSHAVLAGRQPPIRASTLNVVAVQTERAAPSPKGDGFGRRLHFRESADFLELKEAQEKIIPLAVVAIKAVFLSAKEDLRFAFEIPFTGYVIGEGRSRL